MSDIFLWYLSVGCALYLVAAIAGWKYMLKSSVKNLALGFCAVFVWPWIVYETIKERQP